MPGSVARNSPACYSHVTAEGTAGALFSLPPRLPAALLRPNQKGCPNVTNRFNSYAPYLLSVLRIVTALLFIAHGTGKYFGFPSLGMPTPSPLSLFGIAGL